MLTRIVSLLFIVPVVFYASHHPLTHVLSYTGDTSSLLDVFIGVIILDLSGYIFHRMSHKNKFMWRFHEIHHLDEVLDATTGLRVHFVELILHMFFNLVIIFLLGISLETILVHSVFGYIIAIFHHSRIRLPIKSEKLLSYLITTPRFHEVHHDKGYKNSNTNYSFIFTAWDRLLNTYHSKTFKKNWNYGLAYQRDVDTIESILRPLKKY